MRIPKEARHTPRIYPELDRYRDHKQPQGLYDDREMEIEVPFRLATHDLPPPTPSSILLSGSSSQISAISGSPSTKFSESPGPGAFSRDTTPTSMSSQSPGLFVPNRFTNVKRHHSPSLTRPPVSRRRAGSFPNELEVPGIDPQGLPAVRESLTSSSSNSTVRDAGNNKVRQRKIPQPPSSPPPRKSSQKFQRTKDQLSNTNIRPSTAPESAPKRVSNEKQVPVLTAGRPRRPSREGTPDMHSHMPGPLPVIQSNLSSSSLPSDRRGGGDTNASPSLSRPLASPPARRQASTSQTSLTRSEPSQDRKGSPKKNKPVTNDQIKPSRTPSPSVTSSFNTRFPFFGRKKDPATLGDTEKKESKLKSKRKGPAAGTGHEGYGRLGATRRRSGVSAGTAVSSQESLIEKDSFLAQRMSPVVISGGEVIENRNTSSDLARTDSSQSLPLGRPSTDSHATSSSSISHNAARTTVWPSPAHIRLNAPSKSRRPSESSDSDSGRMKTTLAFRRSVQRLRSSPDNPLRLPHPIVTSGTASSPMTSFDTSVMSDESHLDLRRDRSRGRDEAHPMPKKLTKRARSPRKWNIFGRSKSQPPKREDEARITASVTPVGKRPVAFYTMMDSSEQEDEGVVDIQDILRNADVHLDTSSPSSVSMCSTDKPQLPPPHKLEYAPSPLMKSESFGETRDFHETSLAGAEPLKLNAERIESRPSRLAQVGRIPKVISNRNENPVRKSFSRPFNEPARLPQHREQWWTLDNHPQDSAELVFATPEVSGSATSPEAAGFTPEFLAFSPRKNSEGTLGTSSSSSGTHLFAGATAVVPLPSDPPAEDEIWDEYNDLLAEDKPPVSATSSRGFPFALETYETKLSKKASREKPMESPTIAIDNRKFSTHSKASKHSSSYSADMTERIRTAFQPHSSPTVPFSESQRTSRQRNSIEIGSGIAQRKRTSSIKEEKARASTTSSSSSDDESPLAQVNLRVGSMTVSKWLSFGHVLFSDVRHELVPVEGSLKRHSILVIDGLGNDDWSFYAAETYPAATFFNLSPRAPLPSELKNSPTGFPLSPPNHHQIQYISHLDKFPFAPQSFASMVYRFPVAASEATYRSILTEARRVLKPDGYLELSILDVDLNNMGHLGRKAVRGLKERIHDSAPDTSLASTADLIVRLLGVLGFSSIKAARVGVPVASSTSKPRSTRAVRDKGSSKTEKNKPSLAEMMSDDSPVADEGITKMVSRVGRWWYTRCYENAAGCSRDPSIWNDKHLLRECEEMGTSLKLMVCCARAPDRITSF